MNSFPFAVRNFSTCVTARSESDSYAKSANSYATRILSFFAAVNIPVLTHLAANGMTVSAATARMAKNVLMR